MRHALGVVAVGFVLGTPAAAQLQGRVVGSGAELIDVLVSLERETGQIVHQTFTSTRGTFRLEGVNLFSVSNNNPHYLVIRHEGYKAYRRRLQQLDFRGGGSVFTVFLEPEDRFAAGVDGDDPAVDVRQLQAAIPESAFREYTSAQQATAEGDYQRAAERLERAVEIAPDYYDAWIELGSRYDQLGRYEDAKASYLNANDVNPAGALAPVNLGALYYRQGERERAAGDADAFGTYSLAEEWLRMAVDRNPASADARFLLGTALYRLDRYAEAEETLTGAMALDDASSEARVMLINVYVRQNRYAAALDEAVAFLGDYPDAPESEAVGRVVSQLEAALGR